MKKIVNITADVFASVENIVYRVYIDDTLMTERTFAWNPWKNCVRENMVIEVEEGTQHTVRVEAVKFDEGVSIDNITVDGAPADKTFVVPKK